MRMCSVIPGLAATGLVASAALAGPLDDTFGAIKINDKASLGLKAYSVASTSAYINSNGEVDVKRGAGFADLGTTMNGQDNVVARWDEFLGASTNVVQVTWKTEGGTDLLPSDATIGGQAAPFLGWRVGANDPVEKAGNVQSLNLMSVKIFTSTNSGQSFDVMDLSSTFGSAWDGTDINRTVPLGGLGVNYIIAEYEYAVELVPTPGTAAVLGLAGAAGLSRRRRGGAPTMGPGSDT